MFFKKHALVVLISCSALPVAAVTDPSKSDNDFFSQLDPFYGQNAEFKDPISRNDVIDPISDNMQVADHTVTCIQYPVAVSINAQALSGHLSLKNGLITYKYSTDEKTRAQELLSPVYEEELMPGWTKDTTEGRNTAIVTSFLSDHLLRGLSETKEVPGYTLTRADKFFYLSNNDALLITPDLERTVRNKIIYTGKLCVGAAAALATVALVKHVSNRSTISFSRDQLFEALKEQTKTIGSNSGVEFTQEVFDTYMPGLDGIRFTLSSDNNQQEIITGTETVMTTAYGPTTAPAGSYATSKELRDTAKKEMAKPSKVLAPLPKPVPKLSVLEYSQKDDMEELFMNNLELTVISDALSKHPRSYTSVMLLGKELETGTKEWISCTIVKSGKNVQIIITDPLNKDRLQDATVQRVKKAVEDGLLKKVTLPKNDADGDLFALGGEPTKKKNDSKEAEVNYDAPLAQIPLEELETLEDLFGGNVPNLIKVRINQLTNHEFSTTPVSARIKNCIILYGPPGTGKSTIAQVLSRTCGWDIVYAGGGDFRTAYQGSGKAKLDALFAEAKKRKPCVVLIDEIDGTTSKLQPNGSTQEDNRAIKALITTLDQHRYDPDIFVICTTNYPENIDPAVLRRFNSIEISLPDYKTRRRIFEKFFVKLNISIGTGDDKAVTPSFFDKIISATDGFSGDKIIDMLVNAKFESDADLQAEASIGFSWRLKGINIRNKSILSNLGQTLLLPLAPLFHMLPDSEMDKHIYTQYIRHVKQTDDIENLEWMKDPRNNNHKYSWGLTFNILGKEAFKSIIHGVFSGIGSQAVSYAGGKISPHLPGGNRALEMLNNAMRGNPANVAGDVAPDQDAIAVDDLDLDEELD